MYEEIPWIMRGSSWWNCAPQTDKRRFRPALLYSRSSTRADKRWPRVRKGLNVRMIRGALCHGFDRIRGEIDYV